LETSRRLGAIPTEPRSRGRGRSGVFGSADGLRTVGVADGAFQGEARPASFERGKQELADGDQALGEEDLDQAKDHFVRAVEFFAKARDEAEAANVYTEARNAWAKAISAADEDLLAKHVQGALAGAKAKMAQAEAVALASPGRLPSTSLSNSGWKWRSAWCILLSTKATPESCSRHAHWTCGAIRNETDERADIR